jgi:imidazolonepropionase-like amidohydrolase
MNQESAGEIAGRDSDYCQEKMMRTRLWLLLAFLTSSLWAQTIAIKAGNLIDPAKGTVARDQIILVEDGKIKSVGSGSAVPGNAQVIDLSREWVLPGLMDAHTHLTLTEVIGGNAPFESFYLKESTAYRAMRALHNGEILLRAGFTTIRDVGNDADYAMKDAARAVQAGWFTGPTMLTSGKIIAPFGGQSNAIPQEQGEFWKYEYIDADSPAEMRKAVRQNIYYGADVIKLVADNNPYHLSLDEIRAAVDEAHHAGRPVAVHVYGGEAAQNVIEGGVDSLEHGFELTDAQLQLMKQKGIVLVGTDFPRSQLDIVGTSGGIFAPPEVLAPKIIDRLRRARNLGVTLAFGTDTVIEVPGKTRADLMLDYLQVWRQAGVPPAEILRAMTTNPAKLFRVDQTRGAIAPGLAADIIATPGNPLDDIEALRQVNFVVKDGKVVRTLQ